MVVLAFAGVASPAIADEAAAIDAIAAEGSRTIVVNGMPQSSDDTIGSKTATAIRDVPASIITVPREVLDAQKVLDLNEAVRNVSGVQPIYGGGYGFADSFVIRGLRMRFLRDGIPDGPTFVGYARSFADVESLSVLKGPGSAVYGRSEPGGVINIVTKRPLFSFAASGSGTAGTRDSYSLQGDITGPVANGLALRGTGEYTKTDGYRGLSRRTAAGSASALWEPGEGQAVVAKFDIQDQHFVVDNFGIPADPATGDPYRVPLSTRYYTPNNFVDQRITRFTVQWTGEITPDLGVRAAYRVDDRKLDFRRNAGFNYTASGRIGSRSQRAHRDRMNFQVAQLEATIGTHFAGIDGKTLIGAEIERSRFNVRRSEFTYTGTLDPLAPAPEPSAAGLVGRLIFDREIKSDTASAYVQHEVSIGEWLRLRGGYRRDWVNVLDRGVSTARPVAGQAGPFVLNFNQTLNSWQVGGVVHPIPALSLYAGYSKGEFVSIQSESTILSVPPERSSQAEIGVKWDIVPDKLNLNLAAFKIERRNYLVTLIPGGNSVPVGAQDGKGFEIDIAGEIVPRVKLIANYAFLDAEIVASEIATTFAGTPFVVTGSIFGKEPQASPRHAASFWATWDLSGALEGFGLGAGVVYKGRSFADSQNAIRTPGYTIGNAAAYWRGKNIEAALNVKNLTNENYFSTPTFTGSLPGDPRTVLFTLTARI
ncbi:MAG: TonB-dependent receptor [Novosphingobium sp.]